MNRKNTILEFIRDENYVPMRKNDIAALLDIPKEDIIELDSILTDLENDGKIVLTSKKRYIPADETQIISGRFRGSGKGFGFVTPENGEDIFVMSEDTLGAMDGDKVLLRLKHMRDANKKREGKIFKITEHAHSTLIGTYRPNKHFGFVIPDDRKLNGDIFIPKGHNMDAKNGQKVEVRITKWPEGDKNAEGEITEIIGYATDIGVDVLCVLKKYGIVEEFGDEAERQTEHISSEITKKDLEGREDFRDKTVITIDGADAKDLDDAVCVEKIDDKYRLSVHIADVSHYVTEGSPLDKEAQRRGTSVYFTDRVVPMLPKKLSNGICSLNPREDKLTLSAVMVINSQGELISHHITEGIINTKERMTYDDVTKILDGDAKLTQKYSHIIDDIQNMYTLSQLLRKNRMEKGSIDFDFPETKIEVDKNGVPTNVYKYRTGVSNHIIEEFMLMANKTVAENFYWLDLPFVYRIHEQPSLEKISNFNDFLKPMGLKIHGSEPHPMEFSKMLTQIKGTEKELLISKVMLRSLMKAKYSNTNEGHFGLAFKYYCHFTSPIRRYPDLAIHRIIKEFLKCGISEHRMQILEKFTQIASVKSSEAEINAMEAEREVEDMKKAEYMSAHIGEQFSAIISSVTGFGFFAELENGIEGLVRVADLHDDHYIFSDRDYTLTGRYSGKTYKIGDKIDIIVANANKELRQIDFYPLEEYPNARE